MSDTIWVTVLLPDGSKKNLSFAGETPMGAVRATAASYNSFAVDPNLCRLELASGEEFEDDHSIDTLSTKALNFTLSELEPDTSRFAVIPPPAAKPTTQPITPGASQDSLLNLPKPPEMRPASQRSGGGVINFALPPPPPSIQLAQKVQNLQLQTLAQNLQPPLLPPAPPLSPNTPPPNSIPTSPSSSTRASTMVMPMHQQPAVSFSNGTASSGSSREGTLKFPNPVRAKSTMLSAVEAYQPRIEVTVVGSNAPPVLIDLQKDDSLGSLKPKVLPPGVPPNSMHKYVWRAPGGLKTLDETTRAVELEFVRYWTRRRMPCKLFLEDSSSNRVKNSKKLLMQIGDVLTKSVALGEEPIEVVMFRQQMSRVRAELRANQKSVAPPPPPAHLVNTMLSLQLSFRINNGTGSSTLKFKCTDTAASVLESAVKTAKRVLNAQQLTPAHCALQVPGQTDFIEGNAPMYTFEYIRKLLERPKIEAIPLVFVERGTTLNNLSALSTSSSDPDELDPPDDVWPVLKLSQFDMQSEFAGMCVCALDVARPFRVRVAGVDREMNPNASPMPATPEQYYVMLELSHGGEPINDPLTTPLSPGPNPRWTAWLATPSLKCASLPLATRASFTLFSRIGSVTAANAQQPVVRAPSDVAVAWCNLTLFDFQYEMRAGDMNVTMWNKGPADRMGTTMPSSQPGAPVLQLSFDSSDLPVVFPAAFSSATANGSGSPPAGGDRSNTVSGSPRVDGAGNATFVELIARHHPLSDISQHKTMLWQSRRMCPAVPGILPKLLQVVPYTDPKAVEEVHNMLSTWKPLAPEHALELLGMRYADAKVRQFAVNCLDALDDNDLNDYIPQFAETLKYEPFHDSACARFLLRRCLNARRLGKTLFWYLRSNLHLPDISVRYTLMLEAYLRGCGEVVRKELSTQQTVLTALASVASECAVSKLKPDARDLFCRELLEKRIAPLLTATAASGGFTLPLDLPFKGLRVKTEKCKVMGSKKAPLWLVFESADPGAPSKSLIFKTGDDLRQDMLTLQMFRVMDKLWKKDKLDLNLSIYGCVSTNFEEGMIEVVPAARTLSDLELKFKGTLKDWLMERAGGNSTKFAHIQKTFMTSCAGYCVATYVLGIADRHNDNIMVTEDGKFFHIDFGHFLGHWKEKYGFKREDAPFVLTDEMATVMGGQGSPTFEHFVRLCCMAYNTLRRHASVFINLFLLMLSTGIPELTVPDLQYLLKSLALELNEQAAAELFTANVYKSLDSWRTVMMHKVHNWKKGK